MKPQKQFALPTMNSIFNYYDAFRRHAFPGPHASQTALEKSLPRKIKRLMEKMMHEHVLIRHDGDAKHLNQFGRPFSKSYGKQPIVKHIFHLGAFIISFLIFFLRWLFTHFCRNVME